MMNVIKKYFMFEYLYRLIYIYWTIHYQLLILMLVHIFFKNVFAAIWKTKPEY